MEHAGLANQGDIAPLNCCRAANRHKSAPPDTRTSSTRSALEGFREIGRAKPLPIPREPSRWYDRYRHAVEDLGKSYAPGNSAQDTPDLPIAQVRASWRTRPFAYTVCMDKEEHLQKHLELCKAVYEHLKKTGQWPWPDSQNPENLLESEDNPTDPCV